MPPSRAGRPRCSAAGRVGDDGRIVLANGRSLRLSPSSIASFEQCPLLFRRRHVERLPEPVNPELAAGIVAHKALADLYALEPAERSLDAARCLFRDEWRRLRATPRFGSLFGLGPKAAGERTLADVDRERAWGLQAFERLRNYFQLEDPTALAPLGCEERVSAEIADARAPGAAPIPVTGTIDRLERDGDGGALVVVDYKTGRSPPAERRDAAFRQLQIYALLLAEAGRATSRLRLIFLGDARVLEAEVGEADLEATREAVRDVWRRLGAAFRDDAFEPRAGRLCDWCAHKASCPAFAEPEGAGGAPAE